MKKTATGFGDGRGPNEDIPHPLEEKRPQFATNLIKHLHSIKRPLAAARWRQ